MDRRLRRAAALAALLLLGLPAMVPLSSGDPFHLIIDNSVVGSPEAVDSLRWVGQSIVPATTFVVTRVSLNVQDTGTSDTLLVEIRDVGGLGFPGSTVLASGSADGPAAQVWLDIDVSPRVFLSAGTTYWIVASSIVASGYDWWNSNDDSAYLPGTAATSGDGFTWSGAGKDYSFQVWGFTQPSFAFSASAVSPTVGPGQTVMLRANFTNAGPGRSAGVWVNVTLPPELTYTGDDAISIGGVLSGTYDFAFADVDPGAYSFNLTARAASGVADGTILSSLFAFEGADHNGVPLSGSGLSVPVTMRNARVSLSVTASATDVDPGARIVLNATVTNLGAESAMAVVVEGTVDANVTYNTSSPLGTYNVGPRTVTWNVGNLGPATARSYTWTVDVPTGTVDQATIASRARVRYEDIAGVPFPDEATAVTTTVHRPIFAPTLLLDRSDLEAGMEVLAFADYANAGSGPALRAWLNWSLGGHYALVSLFPVLPFTPTAAGFSIPLTNVLPGPHIATARLRVVTGLQDGLAMGLTVSFEATDGNGNLLPPPNPLEASVDLRAPTPSLSLAVSNGTVSVGNPLVLNVVIENTGRASANGWLNLTLPAAATYVADNGTFALTATGGQLSWRIPSLPAGARIHLGVTLRGQSAASTSFRFALAFSDGAGTPAAIVRSNAVAVDFVGGAGDLWWWLLGLAVALGAPLGFLAWTRGKIEEVFLVSYSGILLAHLSNAMKAERDRDLLTGMLTAVQDFIRDSFVTSEEGELRRMDFGDQTILIRRGTHSYLAAVVRGRAPLALQRKMEETLRKLEKAFPESMVLQRVDGKVLDGAGEILGKELLGR